MRYAKLHLSLARELNRATQVEVAEHNVSVLQRHNLRHRETDPEKEVMLSAEELISPVSHGDTSGTNSHTTYATITQYLYFRDCGGFRRG